MVQPRAAVAADLYQGSMGLIVCRGRGGAAPKAEGLLGEFAHTQR